MSYPAPYGNYWWGARHQLLYTAAELSAAGLGAGNITTIAFNVTALNGTTAHQGYNVQMKNTTVTSLTTTWETGLTTVLNPAARTPVLGWNTYTLDVPFNWDGTSNLLVEVCFNNSSYTYNASTQWTTGLAGNYAHDYHNDASGICTDNSAGTLYTTRPNVQFTGVGGVTGNLQGYVYNSQSGCTTGLVGATVTNGTYTTTTDGSGFYQFIGLATGTYSFTASLAGYNPQTIAGIVVTANNTTLQDFCLTQCGNLQGYVYDAQGGCTTGLAGATVTNGTYTTTTDGTGFYQFLNLIPDGTYSFTASLDNYVDQTINNIIVSSGATTNQDFCLEPYLAPPVGLTAEATGNDVHLEWMPPGSIPDQWIFWDDGVYSGNAIGAGTSSFAVASRWPVADISGFAGMFLTQIEFVPYMSGTDCNYTIKVWQGANAGTLLYSYAVPTAEVIADTWVNVTFPGVLITGTDEFWFGYEVTPIISGFPAGCDDGPAIVNKGDMIYFGGVWASMYTAYALNYNWSLHGWISASSGAGPLAPMPLAQTEKSTYYQDSAPLSSAFSLAELSNTPTNKVPTGIAPAHKVAPQQHGSTPKALDATLTGYNVYRNTVQIANNIANTFYDDLDLAPGGYDYQVSAQYDYGESVLIGPAHVDIYSCDVVTDLLVPMATVTTTSAIANWTPSIYTPATEWIVEYGPAGFAHGAGIAIQHVYTTPTYTMNSLAPGTAYDVYVRTFCAIGDSSLWVMQTFRTHYFECPVGATAEVELCGEDLNGGCNMTVPAFEPLLCGETKCGTGWYNGGLRDTDWYEFSLTETTDVTWSGSAEFSMVLGFIASPCPATAFIAYSSGAPGTTVTVTYQLAAGTYYAFAAPAMVEAVFCDSLDLYFATLTCNTCAHPTAQVTSNITDIGADFSWTDPDGLYWDLYIVPTGDPAPTAGSTPTVDNHNATSYTWTGGVASTNYDWYVRTDCGQNNTDVSSWTGPVIFATLSCDPSDICDYSVMEVDSFGDGWNGNVLGFKQNGVIVATFGTGFITGTSYGPEYAGLCDNMFTEIVVVTLGSYQNEVGFTVYDPSGTQIFNWPTGGTFDATTVFYTFTTACPACPAPKALTATNITPYSALIGWAAGDAETAWEYYYSFSTSPAPTGAGTPTLLNPTPLTGLAENTAYLFYVRAFCDPEYSTWAGPYYFNTPESCPMPSGGQATNITSTSADLGWISNANGSAWDVELGLTGFIVNSGTEFLSWNETEDNPVTIAANTLTPETTYDFYVREICGFVNPKIENFYMAQNVDYVLEEPLSGGYTQQMDPGETMEWLQYNQMYQWYNIWFYNDPLDVNKMKTIRMGFWIKKLDPLIPNPATYDYVINWSTPDWNPPIPGFPTPDDEMYIERSPEHGQVELTADSAWVEIYYTIPDYNPEWVSVDIWGQNIIILNEVRQPPMDSPLLYWWMQNPQRGGILVHECLPKPSGDMSGWAGPYTFTTGCAAFNTFPLTENFEGTTFPPHCWSRYLGLLAAPSTLTPVTYGWIQDDWRNVISPVDKAARVNIWSTSTNYWLMTPPLDLGAGNYQLEFDLTLNAYATSDPPGTTGVDDKFAVVISIDGGTTWTSANTIRLWDNAGSPYVYNNINYLGEHITIPLTGYSGIVMIGFYGESTVSNADNDLMINNLLITAPPPCTTNTWIGTAGPEWNIPANWSCGVIPDATMSVIIPPGLTNYPTVPAGVVAECFDIEIATGATFTVATGGTFNVVNP
jgi:hypothetical protein